MVQDVVFDFEQLQGKQHTSTLLNTCVPPLLSGRKNKSGSGRTQVGWGCQ